jgi:glycosyltransferase involved in cell wall biosynthesis
MKHRTEKSVAVFSNYFWTVYNFRKPLILELIKHGYKVTAIASDDDYTERTRALGCEILIIKNLDPKSSGIIKEMKLVWEIAQKLRRLDCEHIFTFTIKPNLFAALTNFVTGKKVIITINGRGNFFTENVGNGVLTRMYKVAFARASRIFFQNKEDYEFFKKRKLLDVSKVIFVRGSGVNLEKFNYSNRPPVPGTNMTFLMACRLLKEKGIFEYLEAASRIKAAHPGVKFRLLGVPAINPSAISASEILPYAEKNIIEALAKTDDMNKLLDEVDALVLPSYYSEGIPKILLEGLSKGLPIITTDWVGCRETVRDGVNGFLIKPRSVDDLANAMEKMISLSLGERNKMRAESRMWAEKEFQEEKVLAAYLGSLKAENI